MSGRRIWYILFFCSFPSRAPHSTIQQSVKKNKYHLSNLRRFVVDVGSSDCSACAELWGPVQPPEVGHPPRHWRLAAPLPLSPLLFDCGPGCGLRLIHWIIRGGLWPLLLLLSGGGGGGSGGGSHRGGKPHAHLWRQCEVYFTWSFSTWRW